MVRKQYVGSSVVLVLAKDIDSGKKTIHRIQCGIVSVVLSVWYWF